MSKDDISFNSNNNSKRTSILASMHKFVIKMDSYFQICISDIVLNRVNNEMLSVIVSITQT